MTFTVVYKRKGMIDGSIDGFSYDEEPEAIEIDHVNPAMAVNPKTINQIFLAVNFDRDLSFPKDFQNTSNYLYCLTRKDLNRVYSFRVSEDDNQTITFVVELVYYRQSFHLSVKLCQSGYNQLNLRQSLKGQLIDNHTLFGEDRVFANTQVLRDIERGGFDSISHSQSFQR